MCLFLWLGARHHQEGGHRFSQEHGLAARRRQADAGGHLRDEGRQARQGQGQGDTEERG